MTARVRNLADFPLLPLTLLGGGIMAANRIAQKDFERRQWDLPRPPVNWGDTQSVVNYLTWMIHESRTLDLLRETGNLLNNYQGNEALAPHMPMLVAAFGIRARILGQQHPAWAHDAIDMHSRLWLGTRRTDVEPTVEGAGPKRGAAILAGTDYPSTWDGFIGQEEAKAQLQTQIASAKARGTRIEHTLIASSVPGVGKSTLATMLAYHAGVGLERASGQISVSDFLDLARRMRDHDILFVDEVHTLVANGRNKADWLLTFMTEGVVYTEQGVEQVPDITIVAATTDAGLLPDALLSRFMVQPPIVPYTEQEGTQIALMMAERVGVQVDLMTARAVAMAADNNPRTARRLLTTIRDLTLAGQPSMERALRWNGLRYDGLTDTSVRILEILQRSPNQVCGERGLQAQLGESSPIRQHEEILLRRGLIALTTRGRALTVDGAARLAQENH